MWQKQGFSEIIFVANYFSNCSETSQHFCKKFQNNSLRATFSIKNQVIMRVNFYNKSHNKTDELNY